MLDSLSVPDNLLKGFIDCTKRAAWGPLGVSSGTALGTGKMKISLEMKMTLKRRRYFSLHSTSLGHALTTAAVRPFLSLAYFQGYVKSFLKEIWDYLLLNLFFLINLVYLFILFLFTLFTCSFIFYIASTAQQHYHIANLRSSPS